MIYPTRYRILRFINYFLLFEHVQASEVRLLFILKLELRIVDLSLLQFFSFYCIK